MQVVRFGAGDVFLPDGWNTYSIHTPGPWELQTKHDYGPANTFKPFWKDFIPVSGPQSLLPWLSLLFSVCP